MLAARGEPPGSSQSRPLCSLARLPREHVHVERVRFGDLDAMRHLNNVVFLRYFESARRRQTSPFLGSVRTAWS